MSRRPDSPDPIFAQIGRPPAEQSTAQLRVCKHHGLIEHHACRQGSDRPPRWRCKRCSGEAVTRRHQKVRSIVVAAAGGHCVVCGYNALSSALQFHHVDPTSKEFDVNPSTGKALARYLDEARKCVLVYATVTSKSKPASRPARRSARAGRIRRERPSAGNAGAS